MLMSKFDTGQVSDRAFGTRVRKVEMMRGGRQGNNAFMQDIKRNSEYDSILSQLQNDELLGVRIAYSNNVELETLRFIYDVLKDDCLNFFKNIYYHILRTGRRHQAAECLEILRRIPDATSTDLITDEMIDLLNAENLDNIDFGKYSILS